MNLFKKYWPYNGSYYNSKKYNKNNIKAMLLIINYFNLVTKIHRDNLLSELIYSVIFIKLYGLYCHPLNNNVACVLLHSIFHNGTAIYIHNYNRTLANKRLRFLRLYPTVQEQNIYCKNPNFKESNFILQSILHLIIFIIYFAPYYYLSWMTGYYVRKYYDYRGIDEIIYDFLIN